MAVVVITGCSSGIGLAAAERFARRGDTVYATTHRSRASDALIALAAEFPTLHTRAMDVCDDDSVAEAFEAIGGRSTAIDILINNAGISAVSPLEEADLDHAHALMETNYFGAMRTIRAVLPLMRERRSGTIVNVSSQAGRRPFATLGHYCASKAALGAATTVLAHEVAGFGIRVVLIEPGAIDTPIYAKAPASTPSGPYAKVARRFARMAMHDLERASPPSVVADAMVEALTCPVPRLHILVGQGAQENVRAYEQAGPDAFVAQGNIPDDVEES